MTKKMIEEILQEISNQLDGEWYYEGGTWSAFEEELHALVWEHCKPAIANALKNISIQVEKKEKDTINGLKSRVAELEKELKQYEEISDIFEIKKK